MEISELTQLVEQATEKALNEEKVSELLGPIVEKHLLGDEVKRSMVSTFEELQKKQEAETKRPNFSQWLGDVSRLSRGQPPKHIDPESEAFNKFFISQEMSAIPEQVRGVMDPEVLKSLYTSSSTAGGYLVPTEESRTLIDLTSKWSVVPPLCRQVPMRTNVITFPTLTAGMTAYWIPEATSSSASTQSEGAKQEASATFGQMTITTHVLAILIYVSNQLLDDSDPSIDGILMDLFGSTLASYLDLACLSGAGTATDPVTGLDNLITTNLFNAGGVFNYDDIVDIIWAIYSQALGPGTAPIDMILHPLAEKNLLKVKDADGNYIYKRPTEGGRIPTMWGQPAHLDRNVSITLGTGNQSRIYAGDFKNHAFIGNSMNMVVKANPWGTGFPINQTAFLAEFRRGFQVDSEVFFSMLDAVPTA